MKFQAKLATPKAIIVSSLKGFFSDLKSSVEKNDATSVDAADSMLDLMIDEGALDDLPLIKTALALCKFKDAYHEARLKRNFQAFRHALVSAEPEKIGACIDRLEAEDDSGLELADTMMAVFIDAEKPRKASIMGNLFAALSEESLSSTQFNDALLVVISASIVALNGLEQWFVATNGRPEGRSGDDETVEYKMLPLLMSLGVALHRGDKIFVTELGENIYKYGITGST